MRDWKTALEARLAEQRIDPTFHASTLDELSAHLEELYRSRVETGMSPTEADASVLEELSGGALEQELRQLDRARPPRSLPIGIERSHPVEGTLQDLRYAVRTLRHSPGFTAAAVFTLALGIGANAAIFSIVNAVLLRPLPYPRADRIVRLQESHPAIGRATMAASYPNFADWRTQSTSFQALGAYWENTFNLSSGESADVVRGLEVMHDFFPATGASAAIGRTFLPEEVDPSSDVRVVVISDGIWKRRFGSDPSLVGRQLLIDGRPYTVIGVLPPGFSWGVAELFTPLGRQALLPRGDHRFTVVGRLRDGVTIDQARAELVNIAAALAAHPENGAGWTVRTTAIYDWLIPTEIRESLAVLLGAVFVVLIIACANVANLLLARAVGRQREFAVRVALGARGWRIVRQLTTESVVLAGVAAAIGLGIGMSMTRLLVAYGPTNVPRLGEASFDLTVTVAVFAISLTTVLIFGVAPAIHVARQKPSGVLQEAARGSSGGRRAQRWQSTFTVVEVAFSVALLIAAGLLLRSVWRLQQVDPGFNIEPLMAMRVAVPDATYATGESRGAFYTRLLPEIQALPGVVSVATTSAAPLSGGNTVTEVRVLGAEVGPGGVPSADWRFVSPGYFSTMGIPIRGRDFSFDDREREWPTTIISEEAARVYFPGQDAVGRQITLGSIGNRTRTVIAVAGDVRAFGLDIEPRPMVYYSIRNLSSWNTNTVVWRSAGDPASHAAAIRDIVRRIDPTVALFDVRTLDEMLDNSLAARRFNLYLLGVFAGVSLFLAAIGLFGVMAYLVSQRTREIGIRLALGAKARDVFQLIFGRGVALVVAGAAIGVASAFWLTRTMQSLVFAVSTTDPITFATVPVLLILVALLACYVPARRAMRVDPVSALRAD